MAATDEGVLGRETKTFNFVVKSPPKASFVRLSHKMSKPFLNEVTWYLVSSYFEEPPVDHFFSEVGGRKILLANPPLV